MSWTRVGLVGIGIGIFVMRRWSIRLRKLRTSPSLALGQKPYCHVLGCIHVSLGRLHVFFQLSHSLFGALLLVWNDIVVTERLWVLLVSTNAF